MRVLRVYHGGRDAAHRERDRALVRAGVDVTLVVPDAWPGPDDDVVDETFDVVQLPVSRVGDDNVNRYRFTDSAAFARIVRAVRPDVVDLHAEPFSAVVRQVLGALAPELPVVGYTAQNLDKRFPPPFAQWEQAAFRRLDGLYPCSRQAASVAVGKGFRGPVEVLPLAAPPECRAGDQTLPATPVRLLHVGRLVPWKGALDSVRVAAALAPGWPVELTIVGDGPDAGPARGLAAQLGVRLTELPWVDAARLAQEYRSAHIVLVPSRATATWVEQFGRVVVEAHASGAVVAGYASGALPEVVGAAGVLVAEGDHDALAGAVARLLADPAQWTALRSAGLAATPARTWDRVAAGQFRLLEAAVEHAPARLARGGRAASPQRVLAHGVFGPTARAGRPFALPVLRTTAAAPAIGAALDVVGRRDRSRSGRVRVVFLDHVARLSGGEIALLRLIAALDGIDAHVLLAEDGPLAARLRDAGARVEVLPLDPGVRDARRGELGAAAGLASGLAFSRYVARVAGRLRGLRPDLVHVNSLKAGFYGVPAGRLAHVPVLWHVRDRLADDYLPARVAQVARLAVGRADLLVANSAATLATTGRPGLVIPDPYRPTHEPVGRGGRPYTVGMVGRISAWKGQDVLLRAAAGVPGARVRFVGAPLFGEDEQLAALHRLVDDLGLADRVEFTGHVDDVEAALADLDVLVHASTVAEPFGQVIVEAMAAGLAVVAADAGGPREIVTDGVDGLLTAPGDVDALVAALERLRDPALRRTLGQAASCRAADYRPEAIAPRMRVAYRALTGR